MASWGTAGAENRRTDLGDLYAVSAQLDHPGPGGLLGHRVQGEGEMSPHEPCECQRGGASLWGHLVRTEETKS